LNDQVATQSEDDEGERLCAESTLIDDLVQVAEARIASDRALVESVRRSRKHVLIQTADGKIQSMAYDIYCNRKDRRLRMATRVGAGLPAHVSAEDWLALPFGTPLAIEDIDEDIAVRGFCFYRLVDGEHDAI
jgi:hypothetical protein